MRRSSLGTDVSSRLISVFNPLHQNTETNCFCFLCRARSQRNRDARVILPFLVFHVNLQIKFPLPDPFLFLLPIKRGFDRSQLTPCQQFARHQNKPDSSRHLCNLHIRCSLDTYATISRVFGPRLRSATCSPLPEDFLHRPNPDFMPLQLTCDISFDATGQRFCGHLSSVSSESGTNHSSLR